MTITITEKEYNAISFALTQVQTEIEGGCDDKFLADAEEYCKSLYNIMEKYKKARYKAREFQCARALIVERSRGKCLRAGDIDKIARSFLKTIK